MTFAVAAHLLLATMPQVFPGNDLKLPPRRPAAEAKAEVRPLSELERFRRDLVALGGPVVQVERKLQEMARTYASIEPLILQVARSARATEMRNLMPVARRFGRDGGSSAVADELLFQLLARPLGNATAAVVDTMVALKGAGARQALQQCVRARGSAVRRCAVDALAPMCTEADLAFAIELTREQALDLELRGVDLLRAIGGEAACVRLVELLAKDPALAAAACRALVQVGDDAVAVLRQHMAQPAVDRSYVYAAFALAEIGVRTQRALVPRDSLETLAARLSAPDPLTCVLAAIPLCELVYGLAPGDDVPAAVARIDGQLVDVLLGVVEPRAFVPNLDMLKAPAERCLQRHTGRVLGAGSELSWREWWQNRRATFSGVRSKVAVEVANAATAVVVLRTGSRCLRVVGDGLADAAPAPDAVEVVVTGARMLELVQAMQQQGFGEAGVMSVDSSLPRTRSLELRVTGVGRSSIAATDQPHATFDTIAQLVSGVVDDELWQLYRWPVDGGREAWWREQRAARAAAADALARDRGTLTLMLAHWNEWSDELQARAVGFVAGHPERARLVTAAHGAAAVAALRTVFAGGEVGEFDRQLLTLAADAPGDEVWRDCVEIAMSHDDPTREVVRSVFRVLGPDAVITALRDDREAVRRAAIDEAVTLRDQRSAPVLIELLADASPGMQLAAASACGQLRIQAASEPLVRIIAVPETEPELRRQCLRSLGRVGGPLAFDVLQRSMAAPSIDDKAAAMHGLGELRDPRAAHLLAEFAVVGHGRQLGELAMLHLQRQGASRACVALERRLPLVREPDIRSRLVLMMGRYQYAVAVPMLIDLLRDESHARDAATLLETTTGVDLKASDDRVFDMERWWSAHKQEAQWQWFLQALRAARVPTTLTADAFEQPALGTDALQELGRLMVELEHPHLWVLAAALLRDGVGEDFGMVGVRTPLAVREGLAARYRVVFEARAGGR